LGDVWLGWTLWRAVRFDEALTCLLPEGREAVPWATMAAVLVLARLCEPSSDGMAQRIWVMDRGMTSADNLEWLRQTWRRYLVGTPKSELKKWAGARPRRATGRRCVTASKPRSVSARMSSRRSCSSAPWSAARKSAPCMRGSRVGSRTG
jgi:hypothetical protein